MNIVNKVTLRHLKENKKRTLVTIIGTIISVAMITAVATLTFSFLDLLQRQAIAQDGEWHVIFNDVNMEQVEGIKQDEETEEVILSRDIGYALLEENNQTKPYVFVKEYNTEGFEYFPVKLNEGRLPQAENEIVISEEILTKTDANFTIGDTLTLEVGERTTNIHPEESEPLTQNRPLLYDENGKRLEFLKNTETKTYTIVGLIERPTWEPTWAPGFTVISFLDENLLTNEDAVNASILVQNVNNDLFDHADHLAKELNINKYSFNYELLRLYGATDDNNLRKTLYGMAAIIMIIIGIGSIALIYNAFAISVSERSRYLGMLSSVGATKKQKRNSVFFEGAIIGVISIPIGIVAGIFGIGVTFVFVNQLLEGTLGLTEELQLIVTPWTILIACIVSIITIFISTYLPARKASKIAAIDAIRQTMEIKLSGKKVKTSKLVRKIFGIEAEIGLKNLKRNKRRYRITVFSLVISIFLFLTVSAYTYNIKKSLYLSQDGFNYDIEISSTVRNESLDAEFISSLSQLEEVTELSETKMMYAVSYVDNSKLPKLLQEYNEYDIQNKDGKFRYNVEIRSLDDTSLKAYAEKVGVDFKSLQNPNHLSGIVIGKTDFYDMNKGKIIETKTIETEAGDILTINDDSEHHNVLGDIEIAAITNKVPIGLTTSWPGELKIIVSQTVYDQLWNKVKEFNAPYTNHVLFLRSTDPMQTQEDIEAIKENQIEVYNIYQYRQEEENMMLVMNIFTYGFITLITIISIANIFNTISTSIALRKREFAMLKSVGMTPKSFNKMLNYESIFYGLKALLYGLPLSFAMMIWMHSTSQSTFDYGFSIPWGSLAIVVFAVFIIVGAAMVYSGSKVKKENIIDALKQENI
jgi:putative ABC transport system permease protein